MQKSSKLSKDEMQALCWHGIHYIEDILNYFSINYRVSGNRILAACPIHDGDNKTALNLYTENDVPGMWVCNTKGCHKNYFRNLVGFVHALCEKYNDWDVNDSINWLKNFTNFDNTTTKTSRTINNNLWKTEDTVDDVCSLTRQQVKKSLLIPSSQYIRQKYSSYILQKYDVGFHRKHQRTFFPIYNDNYTKAIGFVSRSVYPKCNKCNGYHHPKADCPQYIGRNYAKWVNSPKDFPKRQHLFNYWFAKPYIKKEKTAILVEGPGDVLRLEDNNIHNSIAIFGTTITPKQKELLEQLGVINLIVLLDNDEAGQKAKGNLQEEFRRDFRLHFPVLIGKDIGQGHVEDIKTIKQLMSNLWE